MDFLSIFSVRLALQLVVIKGTLGGFFMATQWESSPGLQDGIENPVSNQLDHSDSLCQIVIFEKVSHHWIKNGCI